MDAYKVIITTSHGLNIVLSNKQEIYFRSFSHFVTMEDAAKFADDFTKVLEEANYLELDRCSICGQGFTRQNRLTLLKDGRVIHKKCFYPALKRGKLTEDECKMRWYRPFPEDTPIFDYSNIGYEEKNRAFRYAIQIVSKSTIHLYLIEPGHSMRHHFCLSYDECMGLIQEVKHKVEQLKRYLDAAVGKCGACGYPVYIDKHYYKMDSGEVIHGVCMEQFIRSPAASKVKFPAEWVYPKDIFHHVRIYGRSFDPSPFPNRD